MAIKKLRDIIRDTGYKVDNIQDLADTPKLQARELKQKFDLNVDNLIEAIDYEGGEDNPGLVESIRNEVLEIVADISGQGTAVSLMTQGQFATGSGETNNTYVVDHAMFADVTQSARDANHATNADTANTSKTVALSVSNDTLYIGTLN